MSKSSGPSPEMRKKVLMRDGCKCTRCGKLLDIGWSGFSIHHRRMRSHSWDGLNLPSNLICLCGSGTTGCHGWVHGHPGEAYELGFLVHSWVDKPSEIPLVSTAANGVKTMLWLLDDGTARKKYEKYGKNSSVRFDKHR